MFSPEYDDPANMGDEYGSQYGQYGAPYEQYESRQSMAGRSIGTVSFDRVTPGEINEKFRIFLKYLVPPFEIFFVFARIQKREFFIRNSFMDFFPRFFLVTLRSSRLSTGI